MTKVPRSAMTSLSTTGSSGQTVSWYAKRRCARFPKFYRLLDLLPTVSLCLSSQGFLTRRTAANGSQAFQSTSRCSAIKTKPTGRSTKARRRHLSASRMARLSGGTASETLLRFGLQARRTPLMASGHSCVAVLTQRPSGCLYGLSAPMHVQVQAVVSISEGFSSHLEAFC